MNQSFEYVDIFSSFHVRVVFTRICFCNYCLKFVRYFKGMSQRITCKRNWNYLHWQTFRSRFKTILRFSQLNQQILQFTRRHKTRCQQLLFICAVSRLAASQREFGMKLLQYNNIASSLIAPPPKVANLKSQWSFL